MWQGHKLLWVSSKEHFPYSMDYGFYLIFFFQCWLSLTFPVHNAPMLKGSPPSLWCLRSLDVSSLDIHSVVSANPLTQIILPAFQFLSMKEKGYACVCPVKCLPPPPHLFKKWVTVSISWDFSLLNSDQCRICWRFHIGNGGKGLSCWISRDPTLATFKSKKHNKSLSHFGQLLESRVTSFLNLPWWHRMGVGIPTSLPPYFVISALELIQTSLWELPVKLLGMLWANC